MLKDLSRTARSRIIGKTYPKQEPIATRPYKHPESVSLVKLGRIGRLSLMPIITFDMKNPNRGIRTEASNPMSILTLYYNHYNHTYEESRQIMSLLTQQSN